MMGTLLACCDEKAPHLVRALVKGGMESGPKGYLLVEVADGEAAEIGNRYVPCQGFAPAEVAASEPVRRLVRKSVIIGRLTDDQLEAALRLMTVRQKERWRAPDKPSVYADDEETLAVLQAIGADPEVVLAP
jgi:hypothetical protein